METVIALKLDKRSENALELQKLLTGFSGIIETRIGLKRDEEGVIVLDINGEDRFVRKFMRKLKEFEGLQFSELSFD